MIRVDTIETAHLHIVQDMFLDVMTKSICTLDFVISFPLRLVLLVPGVVWNWYFLTGVCACDNKSTYCNPLPFCESQVHGCFFALLLDLVLLTQSDPLS